MNPAIKFGRRHGLNLFFACFFLSLYSFSLIGFAAEKVRVGVVTDGEGSTVQRAIDLFTGEISELIREEFDVTLDKSKTLHANWSVERLNEAMRTLYADPEVDIVLALGFVSSTVAARTPNPPKPTFAPMAFDLEGLPRSGDSSGVANLNYIAEQIRFREDLQTFREIVPFDRLGVVVDRSIHDAIPELERTGREIAQDFGIEIEFIFHDDATDDLTARVPANIEAVMLGPLPRLNASARQDFIAALIARGLPAYSLVSTTAVHEGALAASTPDADWVRLARRNALNIQSVILGENAADQKVSFDRKRRLTINMETARKLDISPRFDILSVASLLNEDAGLEGPRWSLSEVAKEALAANLHIHASAAGLAAGAELENRARSRLRPQISTALAATQQREDSPAVVRGAPETMSNIHLNASQILYSEAANAAKEVEQARHKSRVAGHRTLELDIVQAASVGFLQILKAQTALDIHRRALELSRINLDLARDRVAVGAARASDVYRWESEVASARQAVLAARAAREQAMDALNHLLHRPIAERFSTEPASLTDPSLMVSRNDLVSLIDRQRAVNAMVEVFVTEGLANSPELRQIDSEIAATERQLQSHRKSYWSPEVSFNIQSDQLLGAHGSNSNPESYQSDWRVSLNFSLPLYQGGLRKSNIARETHTLNQLEFRRKAEQSRIEQAIRSNLHAAQSSYAAIELAASAADAARKNLELIQDGYNGGTVSIIAYLDARDAFLNADLRSTDAVYNFLIDLMNLQRATGAFDFFLDAASMDDMAQRIRKKMTDDS